MYTQLVANPQLVKLLAQQEALSRAALMEYECNQADHSMFGFPDDIYQTYQPFKNLSDNGKYNTNYPSTLFMAYQNSQIS